MRISFNEPSIGSLEMDYLRRCLMEERHISGDGYFTKGCQSLLERELKVQKVLLTTSCTHALELAGLLMNLKPGDEVIVPAFTFVSTINAYVLRGAVPVFVDVRPDTCNIDERLIETVITERTRSIIPIHYNGVGAEMREICRIADRAGIDVIEDNAHGLFGSFQGNSLGSFGRFAATSFHETKNFTCGEGGAIFLNRPEDVERAEIIREKGTNRNKFYRGQVDKYTWVDIGSSFLPSDILAALLLAQLEQRQKILRQRQAIHNFYTQELSEWASQQGVVMPTIPSHCSPTHHLFYLLFPDLDNRQRFIAHMAQHNILCVFHYQSLHTSSKGIEYGGKPGMFPVAERLSDCLVRLPFYRNLTQELLERIVQAVRAFQVRSS